MRAQSPSRRRGGRGDASRRPGGRLVRRPPPVRPRAGSSRNCVRVRPTGPRSGELRQVRLNGHPGWRCLRRRLAAAAGRPRRVHYPRRAADRGRGPHGSASPVDPARPATAVTPSMNSCISAITRRPRGAVPRDGRDRRAAAAGRRACRRCACSPRRRKLPPPPSSTSRDRQPRPGPGGRSSKNGAARVQALQVQTLIRSISSTVMSSAVRS